MKDKNIDDIRSWAFVTRIFFALINITSRKLSFLNHRRRDFAKISNLVSSSEASKLVRRTVKIWRTTILESKIKKATKRTTIITEEVQAFPRN